MPPNWPQHGAQVVLHGGNLCPYPSPTPAPASERAHDAPQYVVSRLPSVFRQPYGLGKLGGCHLPFHLAWEIHENSYWLQERRMAPVKSHSVIPFSPVKNKHDIISQIIDILTCREELSVSVNARNYHMKSDAEKIRNQNRIHISCLLGHKTTIPLDGLVLCTDYMRVSQRKSCYAYEGRKRILTYICTALLSC